MVSARKIIKSLATNKETQVKVFVREAEVEQLVSALIFTSQGSQEQGMGMGLYDSPPVGREVWGSADRHFMNNYGKSFSCYSPSSYLLYYRFRNFERCEK